MSLAPIKQKENPVRYFDKRVSGTSHCQIYLPLSFEIMLYFTLHYTFLPIVDQYILRL